MKYVMNRHWYAHDGDDFWIVDERGRQTYRVEGAAMAFGKNLTFYDRRDSELAYITQKQSSRTLGPTFEIYHGDDLQAIVRRRNFSPLGCRFSVEAPGPDDLQAHGNLWGRDYTFTREGKPVGSVSDRCLRGSEIYGVSVEPGEDDLLLLAAAMVIDLCCGHAGERQMHTAIAPRKLALSR
jgi:uncharacterized protein YxjI